MINDNIKCLFKLDYETLNTLVKETLSIENWYIREDKITNRKEAINKSDRFLYLKKKAEKANLSFDDTEVVTWLDSLTILYYVFDKIQDKHLRKEIKIIQEYCIPHQNKRADYLLLYDNKILIIEFSFNKLGYELQYETKLQQAIGYKELLSNLLPKEIDIVNFTD